MSQPALLPSGGKVCAKCGKIRDTFDFRFAGPGRLSAWCRFCINEVKPKPKKAMDGSMGDAR
jgi:hypothetical protein